MVYIQKYYKAEDMNKTNTNNKNFFFSHHVFKN